MTFWTHCHQYHGWDTSGHHELHLHTERREERGETERGGEKDASTSQDVMCVAMKIIDAGVPLARPNSSNTLRGQSGMVRCYFTSIFQQPSHQPTTSAILARELAELDWTNFGLMTHVN